MRLWSLHPRYLDRQGLLALWREGLLAKKVLEGKTRGYRNHPQLNRFKLQPLSTISFYLHGVCDEAQERGYSFDRSKLKPKRKPSQSIPVTDQQILFEFAHLQKKLKTRSPEMYQQIKNLKRPAPHPLFRISKGPIEDWEKM